MHKNSKFLKLKNGYKIDINHLQDLKNVRKTIFNGSGTNLVHNPTLKKKQLLNLPKNTENPRFFEFPKVIKWLKVAGIGR